MVLEVLAVRRPLPVLGAWGYGRRGDVVVVVADESYTDDEVKQLVTLVKRRLSFGDGRIHHRPD